MEEVTSTHQTSCCSGLPVSPATILQLSIGLLDSLPDEVDETGVEVSGLQSTNASRGTSQFKIRYLFLRISEGNISH
jgi:hypothetical protein